MGYITLLPDLPIVWNLIFGVVVAMIYVQGIIILMAKLVEEKQINGEISQGKLSSDLSRKVIHIAAGSFIWIWLFIDPSDNFSYLFNIAVPFLFFLTFLKKGKSGDPEDKDVKTMTRTGDPSELLKGPLYFTIVMMVAGTIFFGTYAGMLMMAIVGWGDGIAPYIGKKYGNHKFKTFGREKSIEGSISVFLFSIIGSLIFYILLGIIGDPGIIGVADTSVLADPNADLIPMLIIIVILGFVIMIVEALSPADIDNLLIPIATLVMIVILQLFVFPGVTLINIKIPFIEGFLLP
ncbi:MAG: diacylglycerol/polyprenol kinase family protein [Candidatus Hodarchaeales archaeon]|jgi:dolichol kinase